MEANPGFPEAPMSKGSNANAIDIVSNVILSCLPQDERRLLDNRLRLVSLKVKQQLNDMDTSIRQLHFPIDCAISLLNTQDDGRLVEVAVIGKEGCTGYDIMHGSRSSPCRVVVQIGGSAIRIEADAVIPMLNDLPFFRSALLRTSALIFRSAVTSVGCSQFHTVGQRLGRWLLAHHHRTGKVVFAFTHDFLSDQLGVQRATITQALSVLHHKGAVRYAYGKVELLNFGVMSDLSCSCFHVVKESIDDYLKQLQQLRAHIL
jgi:CRP-like cAMP-binding protein